MRCLLPLLCLLLATPALAQPDWESVDLGTTEDLHAITSFLWVVGTNGFAATTPDLTTWTPISTGTTEDLLSVHGGPGTLAYVAGRNGTLRYTPDNGATWEAVVPPDATQDYVSTPRTDRAVMHALGSGGAIYAGVFTSLMGPPTSWVTRTSGTTMALHGADGNGNIKNEVLLAVGDDGTLLRSDLSGETWTADDLGTSADLHAIRNFGADTWIIVGEGGLILKSTDDGATWTASESGTTATLYGLDRGTNGDGVIVVGEGGTILESTDYGDTWCRHDAGTTATLYGASTERFDNWFIVGAGGVVLRSQTEGGGNCVPVANEGGPEAGYTLSAPWPNPSAGRAVLSLTVDRPQHVTASVYDGLGRRLATLFDGAVGTTEAVSLAIEAGGLAPGVYVVRARGETFTATRRLTVAR